MKDFVTSLSKEVEDTERDPMDFEVRLDKAICKSRDYKSLWTKLQSGFQSFAQSTV